MGARSGGGGAGKGLGAGARSQALRPGDRWLSPADMKKAKGFVTAAQKEYNAAEKQLTKLNKQYMADVHSGKIPAGSKSPAIEAASSKLYDVGRKLDLATQVYKAKLTSYKAGKPFNLDDYDI